MQQPAYHYDPDDPYPESDGQTMAENTEQYAWLVKIKENLEIVFKDRNDVFIAGDILWYPVADKGVTHPVAQDVLVAIGRPKGKRGSYKQWEEDNIPPQVVFEILSPSNTFVEMKQKRHFYDRYGVQEYYVYAPSTNKLEIWIRQEQHLQKTIHVNGWISPLLKIRFALTKDMLQIFAPSGQPFLSTLELANYAEQEHQRAEQEHEKAIQKHKWAKLEQQRAELLQNELDSERQKSHRLEMRLRELGIDPNHR